MNDQENKPIVDITFRIFGDNLDPNEVTQVLGVTPSEYVRKGDNISKGIGRIINARTGSWSLSYRDTYVAGGIENRVNHIIDILSSPENDYRMVRGYERAVISCILGVTDGSIEFSLKPKAMMELAGFDIRLDLSVI